MMLGCRNVSSKRTYQSRLVICDERMRRQSLTYLSQYCEKIRMRLTHRNLLYSEVTWVKRSLMLPYT